VSRYANEYLERTIFLSAIDIKLYVCNTVFGPVLSSQIASLTVTILLSSGW